MWKWKILHKSVLSCILLAAADGYSQKLFVTPSESQMDERLHIKITGLRASQPVILRGSTTDSEGRLWQSYAGFYADVRGEVDLSKQAPANGTYAGIDVMGLISSMNLPNPDFNRARFTYKRAESLTFKFSLEIESKTITETEITRHFMRPGIIMRSIREQGLVGTFFSPSEQGNFPGVLVLGGSEGGLSSENVAAIIASRGFATLALAYFAAEGLPESLEEIPLEYFKKAIDWMQQQNLVKRNGLIIVGTSKGAEAALLLASQYKEIRAVVGYVPSNVAWSCICNSPNKSSWSLNGKSIPFVPQDRDPTYNPPSGFPLTPAINYIFRSKNSAAVRKAEIPVEKINGPILLISGKEDKLWHSYLMSQLIMARLKKLGHHFADQHLAYDNAGHLIGKAYLPSGSTLGAGGRMETGGTVAGNAHAQKDSWERVLKFLNAISKQ